jgi:hypothetical protein
VISGSYNLKRKRKRKRKGKEKGKGEGKAGSLPAIIGGSVIFGGRYKAEGI